MTKWEMPPNRHFLVRKKIRYSQNKSFQDFFFRVTGTSRFSRDLDGNALTVTGLCACICPSGSTQGIRACLSTLLVSGIDKFVLVLICILCLLSNRNRSLSTNRHASAQKLISPDYLLHNTPREKDKWREKERKTFRGLTLRIFGFLGERETMIIIYSVRVRLAG